MYVNHCMYCSTHCYSQKITIYSLGSFWFCSYPDIKEIKSNIQCIHILYIVKFLVTRLFFSVDQLKWWVYIFLQIKQIFKYLTFDTWAVNYKLSSRDYTDIVSYILAEPIMLDREALSRHLFKQAFGIFPPASHYVHGLLKRPPPR
jgi:hypothetical protein